jgi:hypothetical protein
LRRGIVFFLEATKGSTRIFRIGIRTMARSVFWIFSRYADQSEIGPDPSA